ATTVGSVPVTATVNGEAITSALPSITVTRAVPKVTETASGGTYNGLPYGVTAASVTGNSDTTLASFGDPTLSYLYYAGTAVAGVGSATPPKDVGAYTVVAHWTDGNSPYAGTDSAPAPFFITQAPLTVTGVTADNKLY